MRVLTQLRTREGPCNSEHESCSAGPYATAPQGHSQLKCRPHEHGTDPTNTRPGEIE